MSDADATPPFDPIRFVNELDADAIRDRIDAIGHERAALLVLLRAVLRAKREKDRAAEPPPKKKRGRPKKGNAG